MIAFREHERLEIAEFLRRVTPRGQAEADRLEQYIIVLERPIQEESNAT